MKQKSTKNGRSKTNPKRQTAGAKNPQKWRVTGREKIAGIAVDISETYNDRTTALARKKELETRGIKVKVETVKPKEQKFSIVDSSGAVKATSTNYDKLLERVDRHNEESDDRWFVVNQIENPRKPLDTFERKHLKGWIERNVSPEYRRKAYTAIRELTEKTGDYYRDNGWASAWQSVRDKVESSKNPAKRYKYHGTTKERYERSKQHIKDLAKEYKISQKDVVEAMRFESLGNYKKPFKYYVEMVKLYKNPANSTDFNADKLPQLSAMFQGEITGKAFSTHGSDFTPNAFSRCGKLSYMKIKNGSNVYDLKFDGKDAWLVMDARKNLHAIGKDTKINGVELPPKNVLYLIGALEQVNYITAKKHIENGEKVEYYHQLGEVDGIKPSVFVDHDGFLVINSGNYDIGVFGIEN